MLNKLKKNYFIIISFFLILYFFTNLLSGDRGLFSYYEKKDQLSKTKDVIIYCNTGRRSRPVVYMLKKLHNISVYNLQGGYKNFLKFHK